MPSKKERQHFVRCTQSYRIFLKKFSENPSFDYESISVALTYVYDKVFKRKGPVPWNSKFRLVNTIILNEHKILNDLVTLKKFPKSLMAPLASTNVSFMGVKKLITEILDDCDDCNRYDDEDLINKVYKKFRFCSRSENVNKIVTNLKKKYMQQKNNDVQTSQMQSPIKKRKMSRAKVQMPNPIVLLEKDKRLQEMVKHVHIIEKEHEESKSSNDNGCNQHCNENLDQEMYASINEKEAEKSKALEDKDVSQKDSLIFIKQEIDLINTNQPISEAARIQNECTENQCRNNCSLQTEVDSQSSQSIESSSALTLSNDEENMLAIRMANYNNIIPSVQLMNNVSFIPNAALMFNSNCNACMVMPMSQFQPNIVMINSNGINSYQGMFNNQMQFNNPFVQNPMLSALNFPITAEQQSYFNQSLNPSQEIIRLQTTIEGLRSQINSLGNILANQTHADQ